MKYKLTGSKLYKRFRHLGNIWPSCSEHWYPIVYMQLALIEYRYYPSWMPVWMMHLLAHRIPFTRWRYWYKPISIFDIKDLKPKDFKLLGDSTSMGFAAFLNEEILG